MDMQARPCRRAPNEIEEFSLEALQAHCLIAALLPLRQSKGKQQGQQPHT